MPAVDIHQRPGLERAENVESMGLAASQSSAHRGSSRLSMTFAFRSVRRTLVAKTMLLLWLLGVAVGSANACLPPQHPAGTPSPGDQGHPQRLSMHVAAPAVAEGVSGAADDCCDHGVAQQACQALCDDVTHALVKTKAVQAPHIEAPLPPLVLSIPRSLEAGRLRWRLAAGPDPAGPPVPILFLRLTI
jgi:hypothetical protein